jgi:hypothetical protein
MRKIWLVVLLGGCDALADLLPQPPCEDVLEVDALTGTAELVLDSSDCDGERLVPNGVQYEQLLDREWEPLGADADPCDTASQRVLSIDGLAPDELRVDPTTDPAYAPEDFVDGAWMKVSFWTHGAWSSSSTSTWWTTFRLGHTEDVWTAEDCFGE